MIVALDGDVREAIDGGELGDESMESVNGKQSDTVGAKYYKIKCHAVSWG